MDTTQLLIVLTLGFTAIITIIIGIQIILLLKDVRIIVKNAKKILSGFESLGLSAEESLTEVVGFIQAIKVFFTLPELFSHKSKNEKRK